MKMLFVLTLVLFSTVSAHAVPACFDAFEIKRTSEIVIERRESLGYESTVRIIEESLQAQELEQWRMLLQANGPKAAAKIKKKFEVTQPRSEQEIFEQVAIVIRRHVEASLRREKLSPLYSVYLRAPLSNPELRQALADNYKFLAAIAKEMPESDLKPMPSRANIFGRLALSAIFDTQVRTYRGLARNDELLKIAISATPQELSQAIGKRIRLETGVRWALQQFVNFKIAVFSAAGLTVAVEQYASQTKINDLMKNDPRGKIMENVTPEVALMLGRTPVENAKLLLEDLTKNPPAQASQAEIDFFKDVTQEIASRP